MKTRYFSRALLGLSLVALPFIGGCTQQSASDSNPFLGTANAEPVSNEAELAVAPPATTNLPVATLEGESAPVETNAPVLAEGTAPAPALVAGPKLPPHLSLSGPLAEVVKLTQAGVDEAVLFNFITNTTGVFNLGADEIVYLNDLGVPGNTITTMMQHDQALRELRLSALQASTAVPAVASAPAAPVEEPVASAPSYVTAPEMEAEPAYVSNDYFYDTLSPYGSWVYVAGYGNCWRPTVVINTPGWRPYCNRGRWVYSDCGWYWLSDYSWGATTFHYGRWFNDNGLGWCWYPDTVWAPSWVSWRYTGAYCGWAPLPPTACYQAGFGLTYQNSSVGFSFGFGLGASAYAFVPWGSFCSPHPYQYCLPPPHGAQVYNTSIAVNHLETGGRGQVYNRGIPPERVREYSRAEIRTVHIQDQTGRGTRAERLDGNTLAVNRPVLVSATAESGNRRMKPTRSSVGRTGVRGANEMVNAKPVTQPVPTALTTPGRAEFKPERARGSAVRTTDRITLPVATVTPAPKPLPTQVAQPVPQATPRPSAPSTSVVVIGGRNNTRSTGRDYSVWNTSPTRSASVDSPQLAENRSTPDPQTQVERNRNESVRTQNRGSYSTYVPAAPASPVVTPAARPTPNFAPRPVPSTAPSAARVESRPAPAAPASAPAASSPPAQSQVRPNR